MTTPRYSLYSAKVVSDNLAIVKDHVTNNVYRVCFYLGSNEVHVWKIQNHGTVVPYPMSMKYWKDCYPVKRIVAVALFQN